MGIRECYTHIYSVRLTTGHNITTYKWSYKGKHAAILLQPDFFPAVYIIYEASYVFIVLCSNAYV